jgi:hypothetical protein
VTRPAVSGFVEMMIEKSFQYFAPWALFLCLFLGPSSEGYAQGTCVPASLLAAEEYYALIESQIIEISAIGLKLERKESGEDKERDQDKLRVASERQGSLGAEARCWLARLGLTKETSLETFRSLGPLRLQQAGVGVLLSLNNSIEGIDLALRLPELGGWPKLARSILEGSLLANTPDTKTLRILHRPLMMAAQRWPGPIRLWLEGAKVRHLRAPYLADLVQTLSIDLGSGDLPSSQPEYVVPILVPSEGRYKFVGTQLENFLRFVSGRHELNLWIRPMSEEGDVPGRLDQLLSGGSRAYALVGPVLRKDLNLNWGGVGTPPTWFGFRDLSAQASEQQWIRLGCSTKVLLEKHAEALQVETQEEGLHEPVMILGPPGRHLEHWAQTAQTMWPEGEITALSYDPTESDLSGYAAMIANAKPGTLILVAPKSDVGNLLRFLARAGVWARRSGKKIEEGEHHPFMLAPPWYLQDPGLVRANRFYLDGVRVISDLPPVEEWSNEPIVAQFRQGYGMPPLIGLRAAALLTRMANSMEPGQTAPPEGSDWLEGDSPWGRLHRGDSSLTFELQRYIFAGQKFRRDSPTEP